MADAYLAQGRGFDLSRIRGWYTQETYWDAALRAGSATVRFAVGDAWWERLMDQPERFGKKKARFAPGGSYKGQWWQPPRAALAAVPELWLTEGIFDAIALHHHGVAAVALMSCNNYPERALAALKAQCDRAGQGGNKTATPTLVWALDGDTAGRQYTKKWVARARQDGWTCAAAVIAQAGRAKLDWSDIHLRDVGQPVDKQRLSPDGRKTFLHDGAVLIAQSPAEKGVLLHQQRPAQAEFEFEFGQRLYWFKLDDERLQHTMRDIAQREPDLPDAALRTRAMIEANPIRPIANCHPQPLYFQANLLTDESWYYFAVDFPHGGAPVKNTFNASQVSTAAEFKKRLLAIAPGAVFTGSSRMLEQMMERQLYNIKRVQTIDYIGYTREHDCWVLGEVLVKNGAVHPLNAQDFFDLGTLSLKTLQQSVALVVNTDASQYTEDWVAQLWACFGAKGMVALAFWFGSLFAEQIRAAHKSFAFLEIVGEAGAGKSTLIEFLWKLLGRRDYEGFDPSKSSLAARARNFAQVSNLPVVLIESDRERLSNDHAHVKSFDWDELKTAYNGRSVRARGMATAGNETYEPPFRGAIVISQNHEVSASVPILQRIVHLHFDRAGQNAASRAAALALEATPLEEVSGFVLKATRCAAQVLETVFAQTPVRQQQLLAVPEVKTTRIAKNHGQLLALVDALRQVVRLSDAQVAATEEQIVAMAVEREAAISADHPLVQEFWEAYEYLNGDAFAPRLNHARDPALIAINLNHFAQVAAEHRQQIAPLADLKKLLKASRRYPFEGMRVVNSIVRERAHAQGQAMGASGPSSTSIKCWVFNAGRRP